MICSGNLTTISYSSGGILVCDPASLVVMVSNLIKEEPVFAFSGDCLYCYATLSITFGIIIGSKLLTLSFDIKSEVLLESLKLPYKVLLDTYRSAFE